MTPRT